MKKVLLFLAGILLVLTGLMYSCAENEEELSASNAIGIQLDRNELELMEQDVDTLVATILPNNLTSLSVVWTSNADSIATVDNFGVVTAVKAGNAIITASTFGKPFSAECQVTVEKLPVSVESLKLDTSYVILTCYDGKWDTLQLNPVIYPVDADAELLWTSSDEAVAIVTAAGLVQAVGQGMATIRCISANDESCRDSCMVRVVRERGVIGVKILPEEEKIDLKIGDVKTLSAEFQPLSAEDKTVTWTSSDPLIVVIETMENSNSAQITGLKEGEVTITLKSNDGGFTDTCKVVVKSDKVRVSQLSGLPRTLLGSVGENTELSVNISPSDATNKTVLWKSSDESVATVQVVGNDSQKATVTYLKEGSVIITATSEDNPEATMNCNITVKSNVVAVTHLAGLLPTLDGTVGKSAVLSVSVYPSNATNKTVLWKSSDESIATVQPYSSTSLNATVRYLKEGTVIITALSEDNPEAIMNCVITVKEDDSGDMIAVTGLFGNVSSGSITYSMGKLTNYVFQVSVIPYDATNQNITWTSSDDSVVTVTARTTDSKLADLKLLKPGTATITATSESNPEVSWVCVVTVTE